MHRPTRKTLRPAWALGKQTRGSLTLGCPPKAASYSWAHKSGAGGWASWSAESSRISQLSREDPLQMGKPGRKQPDAANSANKEGTLRGSKRKGSENGEEGVDKETDVAVLQQQSIKSKAELSSGVVRATDVRHVRHVS